VNGHVAASTQNQALCAIVFLYKNIIKKEIGQIGEIVWAKKPKRLPVVFTKDEARRVIEQLLNAKKIMGFYENNLNGFAWAGWDKAIDR
jgi:hypothetical protein